LSTHICQRKMIRETQKITISHCPSDDGLTGLKYDVSQVIKPSTVKAKHSQTSCIKLLRIKKVIGVIMRQIAFVPFERLIISTYWVINFQKQPTVKRFKTWRVLKKCSGFRNENYRCLLSTIFLLALSRVTLNRINQSSYTSHTFIFNIIFLSMLRSCKWDVSWYFRIHSIFDFNTSPHDPWQTDYIPPNFVPQLYFLIYSYIWLSGSTYLLLPTLKFLT
jgi:hypothetical protein